MVPDYRAGNPYQTLLVNELENFEYSVEFDTFPMACFHLSNF